MLSGELLGHVTFYAPATAPDVRDQFAPDSLRFVFIDADHTHPWPTLDLLALLDVVAPGGEVILHDINLPVINPAFQDWGAKYLFDGAPVEKLTDESRTPANIGSLIVPEDKEAFRQELLALLDAHEWETQPSPERVAAATGR